VLITGRQLEYWHTGSMTRRAAVLDGIEPAPTVSIHPLDLEAIGAVGGEVLVAAEGHMADHVKPLKGFDSGVMEIVLRHRGDAFRVIYALQIGEELWVIHAFQKKSTQGIKAPRHEIDLVHERIKRLKEFLR